MTGLSGWTCYSFFHQLVLTTLSLLCNLILFTGMCFHFTAKISLAISVEGRRQCHAPMQIGDKCTWLSYKLILIMPLISQAHIPGRQISPLTIYVLSYWIQFHRSIETNCIANIFRCKSFECFKGANWIYLLNKANGVNGRLRKCEYTFNIIFYDTSFITCLNCMGNSKDLGNELES